MAISTTIEVRMPEVGESVTEGTVLEWHKREGEAVDAAETLVAVSTDKVDAEVPSPAAGVLTKIHAAPGQTIHVGEVLAEISTNGAAGTPAPAQAGSLVDVVTPAAGESVTEGVILEWRRKVGEHIDASDTIVEISTDKVDVELPAPASGTVAEILAAEGQTVGVGEVIARIATGQPAPAPPGAPAADGPAQRAASAAAHESARAPVQEAAGAPVQEAAGAPVQEAAGAPVHEPARAPAPASPPGAPTLPGPVPGAPTLPGPVPGAPTLPGPVPGAGAQGQQAHEQARQGAARVSPVAARAAAQAGIDPGAIAGSGPAGRVMKSDVLAAAGGAPSATTEPLRGGAAALARYMEESLGVPTATSFRTITVSTLDARRSQLKAAGQGVSFGHLIAYAIVRAATAMPVMTRHFATIDGGPGCVDDGVVNLGVAVDVQRRDGTRTLMVPVLRNAGAMGFGEFMRAYDALVERARTGALQPDDLVGANITLTNPGGLGTVASVPRLMSGQGTIVATGAIGYPPGLAGVAEAIGAEKIMTMTSTYDHRVIQGAESGRFLALVEEHLQGGQSFYEGVFASLGVTPGPLPQRRAAPAPPAAGVGAGESAPPQAGAPATAELLKAVSAATALLKAYRTHGHLAARLDPLGMEPEGDPALDPGYVGLTPELMRRIPAELLETYVQGETLADALPHLRETYCGTIAYEIEHITSHRQRTWLREKIESGAFRREGALGPEEKKALLRRLIEVDALERFMHKAYLGQHQFSIEGLDMTVPMLDALIRLAADCGAGKLVVGMAHRGRLNVLAHNLGRAYDTIFAEFEGASSIEADALEAVTTIPQGGTGDVKYHHGSTGRYELGEGRSIEVEMESNPSHLEYVDPVVMGATRAAQTRREGPHSVQDTNAAIPVVIHGDASFPAQGVVAETLNLQALDGYKVGGTVHLIMNNQIGFTTDPDDARSTHWASDLAKGFDVPIIHVNADDVQACMSAVRLAFAFREEFGHDVLIDLIGYRRYGHNESDEPAYTQPEIYAKIKEHKRVWELWADALVAEQVMSREDVDRIGQEVWDNLTLVHQRLKAKIEAAEAHGASGDGTGEYKLDRTPSPEVTTAVGAPRLRELGEALLRVPEGFTVHPKLVRQLERRRPALQAADGGAAHEAAADGGAADGGAAHGAGAIDWAHAEALAFASLLCEGTPVRLTGQDTERGTFSQRHLVLHDAKTGRHVSPIQSLPQAQAPFELHNSPLSELACLGFEYGYAEQATEESKLTGSRDTLVVWEAQYGDFINSAQVIVDQFIASGLAKWGKTSRLTLLLPHGYEGGGPEHSSARLERVLQLAAEGNMRVANLTTPAQYFHLLRRQALIAKERPLMIMTPKSLLRLPQSWSTLEELSGESRFEPVLAEPGVQEDAVRRLILCTGKIYYDLIGHSERAQRTDVAVGRVELLYPFPQSQLLELMTRYPRLAEVVWVQEEPRNMGARAHMFPRLMQIMPPHIRFGYVGRPERASPGEGYPVAHLAEQRRIVRTALDRDIPLSQYPRKTPGER